MRHIACSSSPGKEEFRLRIQTGAALPEQELNRPRSEHRPPSRGFSGIGSRELPGSLSAFPFQRKQLSSVPLLPVSMHRQTTAPSTGWPRDPFRSGNPDPADRRSAGLSRADTPSVRFAISPHRSPAESGIVRCKACPGQRWRRSLPVPSA